MQYIDFNSPYRVHFIGIGGISMSGFAELLRDKGFTVTGSDSGKSSVTSHLEDIGIPVFYGNRAENIPEDCSVVVYTAAVKKDNPELAAAIGRGLPCIERSGMVGDVMLHYKRNFSVAGTHGKTTTTSMLTNVLLEAGLDPTVSVGGILGSIGGNMRDGGMDDFVIESCEYCDSFLHFHPTHAIITNVEAEHLDYFKTLENMRKSYKTFAGLLPENGLLVISRDIPGYEELFGNIKCPAVLCGIGEGSPLPGFSDEFYGSRDLSFNDYDCGSYMLTRNGQDVVRITLNVPGMHNVSNSIQVAAMALKCGIDPQAVAAGLESFTGTKRRFEKKGEFNGVTVIDDYAHHPTEMRATLNAAMKCPHKKLWVVFQPHTYSRTIAFRKEFCDALSLADAIVLADIYAAREKDEGIISSRMLADEIRSKNSKEVYYFSSFAEIEDFLREKCSSGDMLITMGAGNVVTIGDDLVRG